jgi:hypothetical protein
VGEIVCILESLDGEHFYIGITDDVPARLIKHNATRCRTPQNIDLGESEPTSLSPTKSLPSLSRNI